MIDVVYLVHKEIAGAPTGKGQRLLCVALATTMNYSFTIGHTEVSSG